MDKRGQPNNPQGCCRDFSRCLRPSLLRPSPNNLLCIKMPMVDNQVTLYAGLRHYGVGQQDTLWEEKMKRQPHKSELILEGYRGSISHGVYIKNHIDDKDIFGIFIPPKECVLGLDQWDMYEHKEGDLDILYYSLKKFMYLALKGNPNVLGLLWLDPTHYIQKTSLGKILIGNRDIFVGKHVYHSFVGYAYGQLRRMTHYKFNGYMGEKRKQLVDKFGYDTKNASHLIRILKMGIEFLVEGKLHVLREDSQQLLAIKLGEWTLEKVQDEANNLFKLAHESYIKSTLPTEPNYERANNLLIALTETFWRNRP